MTTEPYYSSFLHKKIKIINRTISFASIPPQNIIGLTGYLHDYDQYYFDIELDKKTSTEVEILQKWGFYMESKKATINRFSIKRTEIALLETNNEDDLCPNCNIMCKWIVMQLKCPNCSKVIAG